MTPSKISTNINSSRILFNPQIILDTLESLGVDNLELKVMTKSGMKKINILAEDFDEVKN